MLRADFMHWMIPYTLALRLYLVSRNLSYQSNNTIPFNCGTIPLSGHHFFGVALQSVVYRYRC